MKKIGRYEVVEEVGRGAMGVVYKASDPTIGRLVAIKVLSLDSAGEAGVPSPQDIFMREARAAGRLSHPGIVTIHDALEDTETKNNYIVMEFIPGRTLERVLLDGPPLPVETALNILRQIAEALDYAHQQQIIHRDLKPANILLTDEGKAKITDFGIAKIIAMGASLRTATVMGTPSYMSPEQVTGGEVDARSDLFSLGILAYLMLTGEKPFLGETAAVMFKIVYEDPVLPSQIRPELGTGHDYLVLRSLAKDRNKRYGSAREFRDDLDDVQHGRVPRSEARIPLAALRSADRTLVAKGVQLPFREHVEPAPTKKWTWVMGGMGAAALFLLALLGGGVLLYRHRHQPPLPAPVSQIAPDVPASPPTEGAPAMGGAPATPSSALQIPEPNRGAVQKPSGKTAGGEMKLHSHTSKKPAFDSPDGSNNASGASKDKKVSVIAAIPVTTAASKPDAEQPPAVNPVVPPSANDMRVIQVSCKFDVQDATLTVTDEVGVILRENLKGTKKGGLFHLKGGYGGSILREVKIPVGTHTLTARVQSKKEGSLEKPFTLPAVNGPGTFHIDFNSGRLIVHWTASSNS